MEKKKKFIFDYRLCLGIIFTLLIFCLAFYFLDSFYRIYVALKDLFYSILYYFYSLFFLHIDFDPSVVDLVDYSNFFPSSGSGTGGTIIPLTYDLFPVKMSMYFHSLFNLENMAKYLVLLLNQFSIFLRWVLILMPLFLVFSLSYKQIFVKNKSEIATNSKSLIRWNKLKLKIFDPLIIWFKNMINYFKVHKIFYIIWVVCFCLYFNFFSIAVDFVAYYFYFIVSFDFLNVYIQFYKLFLDLKVVFEFVPFPIFIILGLYIFDRIRKSHAISVLNHHELMNRGFINSCGQATFITGTPGTGKTTALTDMALSQEVMFRNKALELMNKAQIEFPYFPFIVLEKTLQNCFADKSIFNLSSCSVFARKTTKTFYSFLDKDDFGGACSTLFGYDFLTYNLQFDDGNKIVDFLSVVDPEHSVLEIYCKLYYVFVCQSSLIVSNYGVRSDYSFADIGGFPMWQYDFFNSSSVHSLDPEVSNNSHILDWDSLRIGKKMVDNNVLSNAFEFGVVVITEIGKERGNQYDTKGMKKNDLSVNQVNDQFNNFLKLVRHSATIDNFPFIKILFDDQRAESLGADGRELCEKIIHIKEKSDPKSSLWLFRLESIIYDFCTSKYYSFHNRFRFFRTDYTLYSHFIDFIYSKLYSNYIKLFNKYCYSVQSVDVESSKLDGSFESFQYFLSYKKIYSYRFATDSFSDYFYRKSEKSGVGIDSLTCFKVYRATLDELVSEHSFLFNSLLEPVFGDTTTNDQDKAD